MTADGGVRPAVLAALGRRTGRFERGYRSGRAGRRGDVEYQQQQHSFVDEKALPDRQGQYP